MSSPLLDEVVNAVLYEGYILYPYRASSKKNRRERFTFGRVYPESYRQGERGAESCVMQTECLLETTGAQPTLEVKVRFLHPMARQIGVLTEPWLEGGKRPSWRKVPELHAGGELFQTWHEGVERCVEAPLVELEPSRTHRRHILFAYDSASRLDPILQGQTPIGVISREQAHIEGSFEIITEPLTESLLKVTVRVVNQTPAGAEELDSDGILLKTFASTHTILQAQQARFISMIDPGAEYQEAAACCHNTGTWPVLVGDEMKQERHTILSSPIILYDYPKIAPESAGPLFDGTEIDEILSLRILTMTDEEKLEMRNVDEQARRLLERTEALDETSFLKLHGALRQPQPKPRPIEFDDFFGASKPLEGVTVGSTFLRAGGRVRIRPKARADVIDLALQGRVAVIEAVEQDLEGRIHLALVFEDDPGKDLGELRQPGHRFFYGLEEVEPVLQKEAS